VLNRILETEVMDTAAEAIDYDSMDHCAVNRLFVDDFLAVMPTGQFTSQSPGKVFDAGTGTAQIPLELVGRGVNLIVTASDLAEQMLIVARRNVVAAGLDSSIRLVRSDCKQLPDADHSYDAAISNSIIHHIPEPVLVIKELWRILKPGGILFVRDLMRPENQLTLDQLVNTYAGDANIHQQQMFRDSLHAALTLREISDLLQSLGLSGTSARATSDRHWTVTAIKQ